MCEKCNEKTIPLIAVEIPDSVNGWDRNLLFNNATYHEEHVAFEVRNNRGYIRFVDMDDCGCLDHGEYVEVYFCPFCGRKFDTTDLKSCFESVERVTMYDKMYRYVREDEHFISKKV